MPKPIGNQVANLRNNDKTSRAIKQKFVGKSDGPAYNSLEKAKEGERQKPKFKSRKK